MADQETGATVSAKHTGGRPRVPLNLKNVENLAAKGLTLEQIAAAIGIHRATLFGKKRQFSDFCDALRKGHADGIAAVANTLWEMAVKEHNITAAIFFLKARGAGATDRRSI